MKANELRIGNIVNLKDHFVGGKVKVTGIMKDRITAVNSAGTNIDSINIMYVEPIPISEELLTKIGFSKIPRERCVASGWIPAYTLRKGYSYIDVHLWESGTLIRIEDSIRQVSLPKTPYLHQLQNAYYMVANKELEINL